MRNNLQGREIIVVPNADALAAKAAELIGAAARDAVAVRGRFTLALSGGSTPERTYRLLSAPQSESRLDWSRTWLFFGDERCVPHGDAWSNYHLASESLLKPAQIATDHVLAVRTTLATPAACAADYESQLKQFFGSPSGGPPQFDLILLGLGDDGHTASLFPGKPALAEAESWVTWTPPGMLPPPVDRVTFTFPVLNSARQALFLVSGAGKATIVRDVLEQPCDIQKHPSCGVQPTYGIVTWLLDEAAASKLDPSLR